MCHPNTPRYKPCLFLGERLQGNAGHLPHLHLYPIPRPPDSRPQVHFLRHQHVLPSQIGPQAFFLHGELAEEVETRPEPPRGPV